MTTNNNQTSRVICWLRKDLRLHDNEVLARAAASKASSVVPVFCFDPREYSADAKLAVGGGAKVGPRRVQFMRESVSDLRDSLRKVGSDLLISRERPEVLIPRLCQPGSVVYAHAEVCPEEKRVERAVALAVEKRGARLHLVNGRRAMYHEDDLPFTLKTVPNVFTPMRKKIESAGVRVRPCLPSPAAGSLPKPAPGELGESSALPSLEDLGVSPRDAPVGPHPLAVLPFRGGETAALERVQYYLWESNKVKTYGKTRNQLLGGDYSSKFAPWLAAGCLSARYAHSEIEKYESTRVRNRDTWKLKFELLWRDYFIFYAAKHGHRLFLLDGPAGKRRSWTQNAEYEKRWKEGRTGVPFIDANMRELAATGFMSNRGRQNVASYLVFNLGLDWRIGAEHFETLLLDYDPASNWGNWCHAAGVNGGRLNRFNAISQATRYDAKGKYVKQWVPEIANVPPELCHTPWQMSKQEQRQYGCVLGRDYPEPPPGPGTPNWKGNRGWKRPAVPNGQLLINSMFKKVR